MNTKPTPPHASQTMTMDDIRHRIDVLDRKLIELLARRQELIEAAGRTKSSREAIRDETRIAQVITQICDEAATQNLSRDIAEPLWRLLIELSIAHEYNIFDQRD